MKAKFIINGKPKGKDRPRLSYGKIRTPEETIIYENYIKLLYRAENKPYFSEAIKLTINCYYKIAKSDNNKLKESKLSGKVRPFNIKPDIDNVVKIICDALNKVAYNDDTQIVELIANKYFDNNPRVEVIIEELE